MKKILVSMLALFAIATTAVAQNKIGGHEYVDLGLPSGLLWATCNVGATKPEEYGDYFAWGETTIEAKEKYTWDTYKWCKGTDKTLTKYCSKSEYGNEGFTDELTTLEAEDDAATANWGGNWRMPTQAEIKELLDNTTREWTELNGVKGRKFTAKNGSGNSIFLPASGFRDGGSLGSVGSIGGYWSSSLYGDDPAYAYFLYFGSDFADWKFATDRYFGLSVRPVIAKDDIPTGIGAPLNDNGQMINDSWYSIDGKKLSGEPTQKGVYIVNGKKVVK